MGHRRLKGTREIGTPSAGPAPCPHCNQKTKEIKRKHGKAESTRQHQNRNMNAPLPIIIRI
jgi:hypothetical protein